MTCLHLKRSDRERGRAKEKERERETERKKESLHSLTLGAAKYKQTVIKRKAFFIFTPLLRSFLLPACLMCLFKMKHTAMLAKTSIPQHNTTQQGNAKGCHWERQRERDTIGAASILSSRAAFVFSLALFSFSFLFRSVRMEPTLGAWRDRWNRVIILHHLHGDMALTDSALSVSLYTHLVLKNMESNWGVWNIESGSISFCWDCGLFLSFPNFL